MRKHRQKISRNHLFAKTSKKSDTVSPSQIMCSYCNHSKVIKEGFVYVCQNCTSEVSINKNMSFDYENSCSECNSENYEKKGFRNGKQRYICKDCGKNWTSAKISTNSVSRKPKARITFQRENNLEQIITYLRKQEASNMSLKFWYREDTKPREMYDYFIDEKYVNVRSKKGYYIKFLIDKIRKI